MDDVTRYLLVRDADGAILAELDSVRTAADVLENRDMRRLSIVRLDDHPGEVIGTSVMTTVRVANLG